MPEPPHQRPAILCISTYEKGHAFLREVHHLGCDVLLLTVPKLAHANWPFDAIAEVHTIAEGLTPQQVLAAVLPLARSRSIARVVALDEFDLESAAVIREHLRLPGMGLSLTYHFRDKLAMRVCARQGGVPVPGFTGVFNDDDLRAFMASVPGPWLLKPRANASAIGIRTIDKPDQLWPMLEGLGDQRSHYLLERFLPGEVFHVEGITWNGNLLFHAPYKYGKPPMQTMHQGGVFTTTALDPTSADVEALTGIHKQVLQTLGMVSGATHTEFIKAAADQRFYFLETAARVGGAYIAEVVEFATGINPWVEWARIEVAALLGRSYVVPAPRTDFAGGIICLARQSAPDTSAFTDPEIVYRLHKDHHAGIIVRSASHDRVEQLVTEYSTRFLADFCAILPAPDKPTA